jgi:hypothetical protein
MEEYRKDHDRQTEQGIVIIEIAVGIEMMVMPLDSEERKVLAERSQTIRKVFIFSIISISNSNFFASVGNLHGVKPSNDHNISADTREHRELFVGNVVGEGVTDTALISFLNDAMKRAGLYPPSKEGPIFGCRMNTKFCFIEFQTIEDCSNALNLNGIPFMGQCLKISRPSKYSGPQTKALTWQAVSPSLITIHK